MSKVLVRLYHYMALLRIIKACSKVIDAKIPQIIGEIND